MLFLGVELFEVKNDSPTLSGSEKYYWALWMYVYVSLIVLCEW